jgi:hypothetical protein
MDRAAAERTKLTAFLLANADTGALGDLARQYTYQEFPQHFVYKPQTKLWQIRRQNFAIGRMYFVSPHAGERFFLRTLLSVVRGPRSWDDLYTYGGTRYSTFREACLARGLLEDDGEWDQCLAEAAHMQTGSSLRRLFCIILQFCEPAHPERLWNRYRENICDDVAFILRQAGHPHATDDEKWDYGLLLIDRVLSGYSRSLRDFRPMPLSERDWSHLTHNAFIQQQTGYNAEDERRRADEQETLLNEDQRSAYDQITHSALTGDGDIFFLEGPGGTGKTFVYRAVCNRIRGHELIVLCVASSGIAALLLPGGRTAHSTFHIPIRLLDEHSRCAINKESDYADMLRQVRLIVWDEAGNQDRYALEAVDRTLRDIRSVDRPFGGITVVFGGDFRQTLPVVRRAARPEIVSHTLRRSSLWEQLKVLRLRRNMRVDDDVEAQEYARWLLEVGEGKSGDSVDIPATMRTGTIDSLIDAIYTDVTTDHAPPPPEYFLNRTILSARNTDVDEVNEHVLDRMPGESTVFLSADSIEREAGADDENDPIECYPPEYLRTLRASGLPPGELHVKSGCPLILLRNLAPQNGLCNGTRMVLLSAQERVLKARIIGGEHDGDEVFIPRITLSPSDSDGDFSFKLNRRQFPVRLAFAMSINKAQGQSVKHVGLDLRTPVFSHGQLYVALSRATSPHRIRVLLTDERPSSTVNIVYPEVLLGA